MGFIKKYKRWIIGLAGVGAMLTLSLLGLIFGAMLLYIAYKNY